MQQIALSSPSAEKCKPFIADTTNFASFWPQMRSSCLCERQAIPRILFPCQSVGLPAVNFDSPAFGGSIAWDRLFD